MDDEPSTKRCSKCHAVKPRDAFSTEVRLRSGLSSWCRECMGIKTAAYRKANKGKLKAHRIAYKAANKEAIARRRALSSPVFPLIEDLTARVAALEALLAPTLKSTVDRIAPERPRRKRAVHEHASQAPAVPSATPPVIRTIKDIVDHERVTAAEAKRIQEREILARAEWRPSGNA